MRTVFRVRPHVPASGLFVPRGEEAGARVRLVLPVARFWSDDGVATAAHGSSSVSIRGISPLADPVHELQECHCAPLETRSAGPTAAQYVWFVLREWPLKRY